MKLCGFWFVYLEVLDPGRSGQTFRRHGVGWRAAVEGLRVSVQPRMRPRHALMNAEVVEAVGARGSGKSWSRRRWRWQRGQQWD